MFLILVLVAVCGALPLEKNKNPNDHKLVLAHDSNLVKVTDEDNYRISQSTNGVLSYVVNLKESGSGKKFRRKRFIARSGLCPDNQVMMPKPIGCITCEEYKDITDRDC